MEALALLRMEESVVGILKKQKDEVRCLLRNAGMKRNAVLVDTCLLSQKTADELARLLSGSDFRVLSFDGPDFFIIHVRETIRVLESPVTFVDVTRTLEDGPKVVDTTPLPSDFTDHLVSKISSPCAEDGGQVIRVELGGVNGTSVFGLLLGYPVVYWYSDEWEEDGGDGTCLDGREVVVCKIQCNSMNDVGGLAFSYPKCLSGVLEPRIREWADTRRVTVLTEVVNRDKYAL